MSKYEQGKWISIKLLYKGEKIEAAYSTKNEIFSLEYDFNKHRKSFP